MYYFAWEEYTMPNSNETMGKKSLLVVIIIFAAVLFTGLILMGLGYNETLYSESSTVRAVFTVITNLGEPVVFIVMIGLFYIGYNKRFAKNLALSLMVSSYVNSFLKDVFRDPRPATNLDANEATPENPRGLKATSFGFPSGHTQTAVSTWGYIAHRFRETFWFVIAMAVMIFLIGISRVIIGAHDLQDVVGGFLIGIALLVFFIFLEPWASMMFNTLSMTGQGILIVISSVALLLLGTLLFPTSGLSLLPDPPQYSDAGSYALVAGVALGLGLGYILENRFVGYEPGALSIKTRILNLIIGIIIVFTIYFFLDSFKEGFDSVIYRYARYAVVAFVSVFIVPLVLMRIGVNQTPK
jgi:membrane-associated phospholipid phosphatase